MESPPSFHTPLIRDLKEVYQAEMQLIAALPAMVDAAEFETLYELLEEHLQQTKAKAQRLDRLFRELKHEIDEDNEGGGAPVVSNESSARLPSSNSDTAASAALLFGAYR